MKSVFNLSRKRIGKSTALMIVVLALGLFDILSTLVFIRAGGAEGNPLIRPILRYGALYFVLTKLALLLIPLGFLKWAHRRKPEFVQRALVSASRLMSSPTLVAL